MNKDSDLIAVNYQPKDKNAIKSKVVNNIYAKNFPDSWTEDDLR